MTVDKLVLSIFLMSAITFTTRLFPFVVFNARDSVPSPIITYLGKYLPPTIISAILVYCFKDVQFTQAPYAFKEIAATAACVFLHLWKKNTMLSIFVPTGIYMLLMNLFVA